jgi:hypothetical protein
MFAANGFSGVSRHSADQFGSWSEWSRPVMLELKPIKHGGFQTSWNRACKKWSRCCKNHSCVAIPAERVTACCSAIPRQRRSGKASIMNFKELPEGIAV